MKNTNIEFLRGILILWVILFHYTTRITELYPDIIYPFNFNNGGEIGVAYFFVISGYFLYSSILQKETCDLIAVGRIAINKWWRLYSAYIFSVILIFIIVSTFGLPQREISTKAFYVNILTLWHPRVGYVDGAHWFIADLIFIQWISILFLFFSKEKRNHIILLFELLLIIIAIANMLNPSCFVLNKLMRLFCIDSFIKVLWGYNIYLLKKGNKFHAIPIIGIGLYLASDTNIVWTFVYMAVALYCFLGKECYVYKKNILARIGAYSFAWYLVHQNIGYIIIRFLYFKGFDNEVMIIIPMVLTLCLAIIIKKISDLLPSKIF